MTGFVLVLLFLGELGLAVAFGWLCLRQQELVSLRSLDRINQARHATIGSIRDRRLDAEHQLRDLDRQERPSW